MIWNATFERAAKAIEPAEIPIGDDGADPGG